MISSSRSRRSPPRGSSKRCASRRRTLNSRNGGGQAVTHLVNVGHGNVVVADQIVAIVALDCLPVKRLIESAKGSTKLVDGTNGRRTLDVIVTASDHQILCSLEPATLAQRLVTERGTSGD